MIGLGYQILSLSSKLWLALASAGAVFPQAAHCAQDHEANSRGGAGTGRYAQSGISVPWSIAEQGMGGRKGPQGSLQVLKICI